MTDALSLTHEQLKTIGDILLGAAQVDGKVDDNEIEALSLELARLIQQPVPLDVLEHLRGFNGESFSLEETCRRLTLETAQARRPVLEVLSRVIAADEVHTSREDAYLRRVADLLGAGPEEIADMTMDFDAIFSEDSSLADDEFFS